MPNHYSFVPYFTEMCCHRFYVFVTCGHSLFAPNPVVQCAEASIEPGDAYSTTCEIMTHPFQSWKIDSLCPECEERRTVMLTHIEERQKIKFDEWRWKVSYGMPAHGKDFWGRKADERARLEKETGKRKRKSLRFSWKRSKKEKKLPERDAPGTPELQMSRRTATL